LLGNLEQTTSWIAGDLLRGTEIVTAEYQKENAMTDTIKIFRRVCAIGDGITTCPFCGHGDTDGLVEGVSRGQPISVSVHKACFAAAFATEEIEETIADHE
jgi:hypothetical protein